MSILESLPVEVFDEVVSNLKYLDKKALSLASRRCYAMTGNNQCPDHLTWLIYLSRSPAKFHGPLFENTRLFRDVIIKQFRYLVYKHESRRPIVPKAEIEELLSPYFQKAFPESTLYYYYMTVARDFAKSVIGNSDTAGLDTVGTISRQFWGDIEKMTELIIRWLSERDRQIALLPGSIVIRLRHS